MENKAVTLVGVFFVLVVLSLLVVEVVVAAPVDMSEEPPGEVALPAGVSSDWWGKVQEEIARSEYRISKGVWQWDERQEDVYQAPNRRQGLRTYFVEEGIYIEPRHTEESGSSWGCQLTLVGYGYAGHMKPVSGVTSMVVEGNTIEYRRGEVVEWYLNDERGVEQNIVLLRSPLGRASSSGVINVDLRVGGSLLPSKEDETTVDFTSELGVRVLRYGELHVHDASGRSLPAHFEVQEVRGEEVYSRIRIVLDARNALYPITIDPLIASPSWTVESNYPGANFGWSVALAGDVNGDGFDDIIVGALDYSPEAAMTITGKVYLFYGSPAGPSATYAWIVEGDRPYATLGSAVDTAGDVNGDGYDDVIIGAVLYPNDDGNQGRAYLYYGSPRGLGETPAWIAEGEQEESRFGEAVSTAGDVNGDGYDDVIVGSSAYSEVEAYEGKVYLYYGSPSGLSTTPDWVAEGKHHDLYLGRVLATAGDVNGDGYDDIAIGGPGHISISPDLYQVRVYYGSSDGPSSTPDWLLEENKLTGLGNAVHTAGDVDGDGYDDLIVGEYYYYSDYYHSGRVAVYQGAAGGLPLTPTWVITGTESNAYFGYAVNSAGDVNGDGYDDILVSAPHHATGKGQLFVYYGSADGPSTTADWMAEGDQGNAWLGHALGSGGDFNGDGQVEVLASAPHYHHPESGEGRVYIYHAAIEGSPRPYADWMAEGNQTAARFGYSLDTAGDVNDDGYADVIIGAPGYDGGEANEGAAFLYYGSASGLKAVADWEVIGWQGWAELGTSVSEAGDINGDGYADVAIGMPLYDEGGVENIGGALIYLGSSSGLPLSYTQFITGGQRQEEFRFGDKLNGAGDVNGDGYDDLIVGTAYYDSDDGEVDVGKAWVFYGTAEGLDTVSAWQIEGEEGFEGLGDQVDTAGDVNGDGYDDIIIRADHAQDMGFWGRVTLYYGSASGPSASADWELEGGEANGWRFVGLDGATSVGDLDSDGYADVAIAIASYEYGISALQLYRGSPSGLPITASWIITADQHDGLVMPTKVGDVNGDGYDDLWVGGNLHAALYYGSAELPPVTPDWVIESSAYSSFFGYTLGGPGDVNGDGYDDLLVGAYTYEEGEDDEGAAFLFYGSSPTPLAPPEWEQEGGQEESYFGMAVGTAGDVDGDGYAEIAIGAPWYDSGDVDGGAVFLYRGSERGTEISATWMLQGEGEGAHFGQSVGTAGDVNGDGYADLIVGAPGYEGAGGAFLYLGSEGGMPLSTTWVVSGGESGADFGWSVGTGGDIDGDGYTEVIVGAPWYGEGGAAFVYRGGAEGPPVTATWSITIEGTNARFGDAVGTAGDVNGDGYGDIIIGAPGYENGEEREGGAFIYYGSASGLCERADWSIESDQAYAYLGDAVGTAGDVNGDGYADVIIGVPAYDGTYAGEGKAIVYYGSAVGVERTPGWSVRGEHTGYGLGTAVGTAGDVNGDGLADLLIGVPYYDNGEADEGEVRLYYGGFEGPSLSAAWTMEGEMDYAHLGEAVATGGDVNGDGLSDVVLAAPAYGYADNPMHVGKVFLHYGRREGPAAEAGWEVEGEEGGTWLGYAVSIAGDVNGDGYDDIVVGAPTYDGGEMDEGAVFVYAGSAEGLSITPTWRVEGEQAYAEFGWAVDGAYDVNGDGYADVIIGARRYDGGAVNGGKAYLYYGSREGIGDTAAWTVEGEQVGGWLGSAVGGAGDVNGDGYGDLLVGEQYYDGEYLNEGRAYLYLGGEDGVSLQPDWVITGDQMNERLGFSLSGGGDLNGDGYSDVVVGIPYYDGEKGEDEGRVEVFYGSATGLSISPTWTLDGEMGGARFGRSCAVGGDTNGDGYADLIVGAPGYENGLAEEGAVFVYGGSEDGVSSEPLWMREGHEAGALFGFAVGKGGDVNGDGYADILVGAPGGGGKGKVYLFQGSALGPTLIEYWACEGEQEGELFGSAVADGGDVNGDGYGDLLVGAYGYEGDEAGEGRLSLYYGNSSRGWGLQLRQERIDGGPISYRGVSDSRTSFVLSLRGRMPLGRQRVRMEWEVAPVGRSFTESETVSGITEWQDTLTGEVVISAVVSGLSMESRYHWRVRLLYDKANALGHTHGPWMRLPKGGEEEVSVYTAFNHPPIADGGEEFIVAPGSPGTLDGSRSYDPDGDYPLTYRWSQVGGPVVTLSNPSAVSVTFTAPDTMTVLTFTLDVSDALHLPAETDVIVVRVQRFSLYLPLVLRAVP